MVVFHLSSNVNYQLYFMRKLWLNVVPGKDINADCIFHYHQELPKVLRGYHNCTVEEAAVLAAFQYRVRYGDDKSYLQSFWDNRQEYLPQNLIAAQSQGDWKKAVEVVYSRHLKTMTRPDAKIAFMNVIYKWPTFGSTFYEVKVTLTKSL
ncbi:myosin-VIIa-like [Glandiceps talaboti]